MMYNRTSEVVDTITLIQKVYHEFDRYRQDRDRWETLQTERVAMLQIKCEQLHARNKLIKLYADQFLSEREKLREICMQSIDRAIEKSDDKIAGMALDLLKNLYDGSFVKRISVI